MRAKLKELKDKSPAFVRLVDTGILEVEDGGVSRAPLTDAVTTAAPVARAEAEGTAVLQIDLAIVAGGKIPLGRHHLTLEGADASNAPADPPSKLRAHKAKAAAPRERHSQLTVYHATH